MRRSLRQLFISNQLDVIDVEIDGLRMRIHLSGNACEWKFACNPGYIRGDMDFLTKGLNCYTTNFVDIGANAGIFTLSLAQKGARVIAIEPHPAVLERLHFNVQANGFGDLISIVEAAVGEATGTMSLSMHDEDIGSSRLNPIETDNTATITVMPLEDILQKSAMNRIDGLKIDVEGYEDRVILPCIRSTPREQWPRRIVMEHIHRQRWNTDCIKVLHDVGYEAISTEKNNSFLQLE
jgi:FkbM family methyltransferase